MAYLTRPKNVWKMTAREIAIKYFPDDIAQADALEKDIKRFDTDNFTDHEQITAAILSNIALQDRISMKHGMGNNLWIPVEAENYALHKAEKDELPMRRSAAFAGFERWVNNAFKYGRVTKVQAGGSRFTM